MLPGCAPSTRWSRRCCGGSRPQILVSQHGATPTGEIRWPTASPSGPAYWDHSL